MKLWLLYFDPVGEKHKIFYQFIRNIRNFFCIFVREVCLTKGGIRMKNRKIIITTLVVSLLSFGMIDSATTKSRTSETNC